MEPEIVISNLTNWNHRNMKTKLDFYQLRENRIFFAWMNRNKIH